jgi:hypothetical protein
MNYANRIGYSQVYPYEIIRVISDKTIEVREMEALPDPNWKPRILPGGFAGHCENQYEQTWIIVSNTKNPVIRIRKRKDGQWYSNMGRHVFEDKPRYFYDYNF